VLLAVLIKTGSYESRFRRFFKLQIFSVWSSETEAKNLAFLGAKMRFEISEVWLWKVASFA